jgi:ABC-2 type transport system ATP-binding protein
MNIKVDNVTKIIKKVKVLDHVSLEFESGEITGLKGINGSGKTMIMRIISGLIRPTEGKVFINGRELKKEMDFPESIGVLIDSPAFLDGYSAYDNLRYMASVKNKVSGEEIKDLLKKVELADVGKKKYKYFSLGMKQRLGIAAAIMEHPDIILIDEPTNALDSKGVEMVKCILQQEKERGALIVLTCHDYSVLKELSDSIYFIEEGRVVGYERQ